MKFGLLGCGNIAGHHAAVAKHLGHEISSVLGRPNSRTLETFSSRFDIPSASRDLDIFLESKDIDGWIIATSWDATENIIDPVIATGKPILVEKPVALTSDRLSEIIQSAEHNINKIVVGYNRRFYDFVPYLKQELHREKILSISLICPDSLERLIEKFGYRIADYFLIYLTSHYLDLLQYLVGPLTVNWAGKQHNNQNQLQSYQAVLSDTQNSFPIFLSVLFDAPASTTLTIYCENKIYQLSPIEELTIYEGMQIIDPSDRSPIRKYIPKIKEQLSTDVSMKPGFLHQFKYFVDQIISGEISSPQGCTLKEALTVTNLCEQLNNSQNRLFNS